MHHAYCVNKTVQAGRRRRYAATEPARLSVDVVGPIPLLFYPNFRGFPLR